MMKTAPFLVWIMLVSVVLTGCNMPAVDELLPNQAASAVPDGVADDLQAGASQEPSEPPADDLAANPGMVSGQVCYPSEFIPPMTIYFLNLGNDELTSLPHLGGETSYSHQLPGGTYYAFAFRNDVEMNGGGAYTDYIACGAEEGCGGQSLHPFEVPAGGQVTEINICDWVIPAEDLPAVPSGPDSIDDLSAGTGQVTGAVCYPSEGIPPLVLHFFELNSQQLTSQSHAQNDTDYSQALPPGSYYAFAFVDLDDFVGDDGGGYTEWVACGQGPGCTNHDLRSFQVVSGQTTSDVDICDWFIPNEDLPDLPETPEPIDDLAPAPSPSPVPPRGGLSLNCDGTYQRLRIVDNGPNGKTVYVDDWQGGAWVNVWSKTPQDPFLQQMLDEVGWYQFGGCQKLVIVPIRNGDPRVTVDLTIHAWNGATMTQVYSNSGWYGTWSKIGDIIRTREASKLGTINNGPLVACEWLTLEYTWDGSSFNQTGSSVEIVEDCDISVTDHP
jgi:hypothetical protein